ncbi:MAG TPA: glycosyltransferase family 39 protein [Pirellulales bacterium]|nr:glycosyltransferase family 39 protein [Pirellulales bacterium]
MSSVDSMPNECLWGERPVGRRFAPWRDWEFWALAAASLLLYGTRLTAIPIRGEETRRAEVACEMIQTGDWIVPRQQGEPLLSRPPLGSYPIALAAMLFGDCSLLAVRLPSVIATCLTVLLIYGYGRLFLSRLGAFAAGLAYATMGQVLVLGRMAETEATFTLLLSGALLVWHCGYCRSWPRPWPWFAGYGLAALAALAKGPQAPVYFAAPVGLFLASRRDWRTLLGRWHLAGLALFIAMVGLWQVPFLAHMGWPAAKTMWLGDVAMRFADTRWQTIALHLLEYPLEIAVCTLPWSPLLLAYLPKQSRRSLAATPHVRSHIAFLSIAIGLAFATCWVVPGAKGRYFMPLYPCIALLVGLAVEQIAQPAAAPWQRRGWKWFLLGKAALAFGAAVAVVAIQFIGQFRQLGLLQPNWFVAVYATGTLIVGTLLILTCRSIRASRIRVAILSVTAFIGISYVGVILNVTAATAEDPTPDVAQLKRKLPTGARLVSFGLVETLFTFLYRQPIEEHPWPKSASELGPACDYFCFTWDRPLPPSLPFGWQIEGVIPCDRVRHDPPLKKVIVGRRIHSLANETGMIH